MEIICNFKTLTPSALLKESIWLMDTDSGSSNHL